MKRWVFGQELLASSKQLLLLVRSPSAPLAQAANVRAMEARVAVAHEYIQTLEATLLDHEEAFEKQVMLAGSAPCNTTCI